MSKNFGSEINGVCLLELILNFFAYSSLRNKDERHSNLGEEEEKRLKKRLLT